MEAQVYILRPSFRQVDDPLLYLTAQPIIEGPGSCQFVVDVNTHNIKVRSVLAFCTNWPQLSSSSLVQWLIANWILPAGLSVIFCYSKLGEGGGREGQMSASGKNPQNYLISALSGQI